MQYVLSTLLLASAALAAPPASREQARAAIDCQSGFKGWTVKELEYNASYTFTTPAHQNSYGWVHFNLSNPSLDYEVACEGMSAQLSDFFYGTQIFSCPTPEKSGGAVTFTYNRPTGELAVNQSWVCHDDPQWP